MHTYARGFISLAVLIVGLVVIAGSAALWWQHRPQSAAQPNGGASAATTSPVAQEGADFFADPITGTAPLNVSFGVRKGYVGSAETVAFGDGSSARLADFTCGLQFCARNHVYVAAGDYAAAYLDAEGRTVKSLFTIHVNAAPLAAQWQVYASSAPGIRFQYPGLPYVASGAVENSRGIQVFVPATRFGITVQKITSTDRPTLAAWLYTPGVEGTSQTYYQHLQAMAAANAGGYVASTTVDGVPAVETGYDCAKVPPGYSRVLTVLTVYRGVYYEFAASDACNASGVADFRKLLSTVQFTN